MFLCPIDCAQQMCHLGAELFKGLCLIVYIVYISLFLTQGLSIIVCVDNKDSSLNSCVGETTLTNKFALQSADTILLIFIICG